MRDRARDLVEVDRRGRVFYARVLGAGATGALTLAPLDPRVRSRHARVVEIVDHWRHSRGAGDGRPLRGQLALERLPAS